jgi:YHS domain-containing protein
MYMPTNSFKSSPVAAWGAILFFVVFLGTTTAIQAQHGCCSSSSHSERSHSDDGDMHRGHQLVTTSQASIFEQPPHGGQVTTKLPYFFEVVYQPQATQVYLYGPLQEPIAAQLVRGEVVMQLSYAPQVFRFPLTYVAPSASAPEQNHLTATVDVSQVPDGQMTITFNLDNLPDRQQRQATFNQNFALTRPAPQVVVAPLTAADRPAIDQQQVCPVTGAQLGSMGAPVKILVNEQPLYVCCLGCVPKIRENPQPYLPRPRDPRVGQTGNVAHGQFLVSEATAADRAAGEQQQFCPVTKARLGSMGAPIKITVDGQVVFVCCQGCIDKVQQNPGVYLAQTAQFRAGR